MTIWKFPFGLYVRSRITLGMPMNSRVIHVECQHGQPCLWAIVDEKQPTVERTFFLVGTGHPLLPEIVYVATFQINGFCWHLFEAP